ncbi:MAG TPA: LysM peptidoglycan-binding domain-containing protein [Capsulimonadaceae bacterium]|nr:LysM peptidoglycan-binding domain-containing protein [Capsulimonadaceae bacterium]
MVRHEPTRRNILPIETEDYSAKTYTPPSFEPTRPQSACRRSSTGRLLTQKRHHAGQRLRRRLEPIFLSLAALVAFIGLACSLFSPAQSSADLATRPFSTVSVTVAPGDTLWSLAQRYEDPSLRPTDRIGLIRQANPNLTAVSALVPGQTLMVPVTSSSSISEIHLAKLSK